MGDSTSIEWTNKTFNPWWGCARVTSACRSCYADSTASRWGKDLWRRNGERQIMSASYWRQPHRWNREALATGETIRVFCASMADVFEHHPDLIEPRARLWDLIEATPHLTWQLLTKRPENVAAMAPWGDDWPHHVWLGATLEEQRFAEQRIAPLLYSGARTLFLSCEPLLGPLNLRDVWNVGDALEPNGDRAALSWVITGGETGTRPRPTRTDWFRSVRDQCTDAGVAYLHKQNGSWVPRSRRQFPGLPVIDSYRSPAVQWVDTRGKTHPFGDFAGGPEHATWELMQRTTRKVAGRRLDGREWTQFPDPQVSLKVAR